jgi:DNA-binding transcriptional MerR regulator
VSDDDQPIYSIGAVERMCGIPATTIRNWEERYGLITPGRSAGGHRLYSRGQIEQLQFVKRELARGLQPAAAHRLLAGRTAPSEPSPPVAEARDARGLILLAERDPYAAEFAERFLRVAGYEVVVALDAPRAQRAARERRPDLAIVELTISGGAGARLCTWLKGHGVPWCLALSGLHAHDDALASGADVFLEKPVEPGRFVATVKDLVGRAVA